MRYLLEVLSLLATAGGFIAAVGACVFCWTEASKGTNPNPGQFAIAGAILTGLLAVALAIYLKDGKEEK